MKILDKLTIKHLKSNPKRTIVTIIGIILSTALMVGIGLLFSTFYNTSVKLVEQVSGTHHASIYIKKDKLDLITKNDAINNYKYVSSVGFSEYEVENFYKPYIQVLSASKDYLNELNITSGTLPTNSNEVVISRHLLYNGGANLEIGNTLVLEVGDRVDLNGNELRDFPFTNTLSESDEIIENEKIINKKHVEYKIVGICERDILENYQAPGYSVFTVDSETDNYKVFITYNNIKNTYKNTRSIALNLGYKELESNQFNEVSYNTDLLSVHGMTSYENILTTLSNIIIIVLTLVAIACIIVIYNSFAISVMERKKQFGLFSSIGATKKQLRKTVFFEGLIVGLIGIPLGILSAYLGISIVVAIMNSLLTDILGYKLQLVTYPIFLIIPIIFMIITIFVSAYLPAKRASKVSPIEAIRQNDDIKIKSNKIKSPKLIKKIFGIEGDIAYKNIKRNRKKYRITIISLFISIVLFISFSSILKYGLEGSLDYLKMPNFDFSIDVYGDIEQSDKINSLFHELSVSDNIKEYNVISLNYTNTISSYDITYSDKYINSELFSIYGKPDLNNMSITLVSFDDEYYEEYKNRIGLKENRPIVYNGFDELVYTKNSRKVIKTTPYDSIKSIKFGEYDYELEKHLNEYEFNDIYLTTVEPLGISGDILSITVIVDKETFDKFDKDLSVSKTMFITGGNNTEINKIVSNADNNISVYSYSVQEEMRLVSNIILVVKILLYGFISLVTLIGVTSVLNTINTGIALRRKEFAVLRSIGLTPNGFNKILFFESLFFGLKSLLYGIPVGLIITYLLHNSFMDVVVFDHMIIPWSSIIISIFGVFIIVIISNFYASKKIKHENILDAIREENI